jgi:hypothetical protein
MTAVLFSIIKILNKTRRVFFAIDQRETWQKKQTFTMLPYHGMRMD